MVPLMHRRRRHPSQPSHDLVKRHRWTGERKVVRGEGTRVCVQRQTGQDGTRYDLAMGNKTLYRLTTGFMYIVDLLLLVGVHTIASNVHIFL